jgi:murein DD-endopeptidase MepM/ murein hydrolase activator NlpD
MSEDLRNVFLSSLQIDGSEGLKAELAPFIVEASLKRTTDGVSNLLVTVHDPHRTLLRSNLLNSRITAQLDGRSFELCAHRKNDNDLELTFEDLAVAEMRRHDEPRKFASGSVTRIQAAQALLDEIGWIRMAVGANTQQPIQVELARGNLTTVPKDAETDTIDLEYFSGSGDTADVGTGARMEVSDENREDTWTAIKRWFSEINWNCYVDDGVLNVGPMSAYTAGDPAFRITDGLPSLTSYVNFDWDVGQPMGNADYTTATERFAAAPGTCVELYDLGPANGKWFIAESTRDLFEAETQIVLQVPMPELPEPTSNEEKAETGIDDGYFGQIAKLVQEFTGAVTGTGAGAASNATWSWPVHGSYSISDGFSPARKNPVSGIVKPHTGVDIAVELNREVLASRDGVVSFVGNDGGYGNVIRITHTDLPPAGPYANGSAPPAKQNESRYAHLNRYIVQRGVVVKKGQVIGYAGTTGNSTGVHLHWEIRRGTGSGSVPVDPVKVMAGTEKV